MANVIIYGVGEMAKLALYYLNTDSNHKVIGFCVEDMCKDGQSTFLGLPVNDLENIENLYSVKKYKFFVPMASVKMNTERERIYNIVKDKGFSFISYVSSNSVIYNSQIGENCFIQAGNVLHPFTTIGNNVMIWIGNLIGHHGEVQDHVTLASHVAIAANCFIGHNSYLGTNSTIRDGINISKGTLVGIATVMTNDSEPWSVYMGNPAKRIGKNISKSILKI